MTASTITQLRAELELSERKRLMLKRRMILDSFDPEDNSLWVMLDLITLILVFFIVLYSTPSALNLPENTPLAKLSVPVIQKSDTPVKPKQTFVDHTILPRAEQGLRQAMAEVNLSDYKIQTASDRVMLVIGEQISFQVGRADLLDDIKPALSKLAVFLERETSYRIIVSGHTDSSPISTREFPSNWELSIARALGVAKFLMARQVDPERISVEGFGPYRPVADNNDLWRRHENRRVEISLVQAD